MKMSKQFLIGAAVLLTATFTSRALADDTNTVSITGSMVCGKCTLHLTKECQDVVQVQKDGKTVNYFLTPNDVSNNAHQPVCDPGNSEKVTVTGTVEEKDGKEMMTPTKITVDKN